MQQPEDGTQKAKAARVKGPTGAEETMWLSAAVLCSAPSRVSQEGPTWWNGGTLHPVRPHLYATRFPHFATLALYLQVQGKGEGELSVEVVDPARKPLIWGAGRSQPVRRPVLLPSDGQEVTDSAEILVLPRVRFPAAGQYPVVITLMSSPSPNRALGAIRVPLEVVGLAPRRRGTEPRPPRSLRVVFEEFGPRLTPEIRRVLRIAAREARRFNHGFVGTPHLILALRRVLGDRSGLPNPDLLSEAVEGWLGLNMPAPEAEMTLTPAALDLLRQAATRAEPLEAESLLDTVVKDQRGYYQNLMWIADLLASRPPR